MTDNELQPESRILIRALHAIDILYSRIFHNLTVIAPPPLPRHGPAILVCNHISSLDPVLLQAACTRRVVTWMMAKEYMDLPVLGRVFRILGVIPVERSGRDTGPLRAALRDLGRGRVVGIFPEGSISIDGNLQKFQTGVALMAIKTGAPVYPAYQDGNHRNAKMLHAFVRPARITMAFGPPVEFNRNNSSRENLESATERIRAAVEALASQVHQRMESDKFNPFNKLTSRKR
jgi:1-acyl-sn-glycerol-3-phosphate acyltransferase